MIPNFGLIMICVIFSIGTGVAVALYNEKKKDDRDKGGIPTKKLNTILNTIIGAFVGVFIGHGVYVVWNFKTRPELYAMQSAPWYTSILVYGAFIIVVLLICFVIKAIIKRKHKKK